MQNGHSEASGLWVFAELYLVYYQFEMNETGARNYSISDTIRCLKATSVESKASSFGVFFFHFISTKFFSAMSALRLCEINTIRTQQQS